MCVICVDFLSVKDTHGEWARRHADAFAFLTPEIMWGWAMPSLLNSRTGSTAQIYGNDWGKNPGVWTQDHQI